MRGLPGDSESGENPIMSNNSFKPTPLRGAAEFNVGPGGEMKSLHTIVTEIKAGAANYRMRVRKGTLLGF